MIKSPVQMDYVSVYRRFLTDFRPVELLSISEVTSVLSNGGTVSTFVGTSYATHWHMIRTKEGYVMFAYFRGWKRKAGLVTLAMSCLLTIGWIRSKTCADVINPGVGVLFVSNNGSLSASRGIGTEMPIKRATLSARQFRLRIEPANCSSLYTSLGFAIPSAQLLGSQPVSVSYSTVVLPFTALSAWLLMSKRCGTKVIEPTTDQVPCA